MIPSFPSQSFISPAFIQPSSSPFARPVFAKKNQIHLFPGLSSDQVLFSGNHQPQDIRVLQSKKLATLSPREKQGEYEKIKRLVKHLQPYINSPNYHVRKNGPRPFACRLEAVILDKQGRPTSNTIVGKHINVELGEETTSCDLKNALSRLFEKSNGKPFMVTDAYFISADPKGVKPLPCGECQDWMSRKYFTPDTRIMFYYQDKNHPKPTLERVLLSEILPHSLGPESQNPLIGTTVGSLNQSSINTLPIQYSPRAQAVVEMDNIHPNDMYQLMEEAETAGQLNALSGLSKYSNKPTGFSVLMEEQEQQPATNPLAVLQASDKAKKPLRITTSAGRHDWSTIYQTSAEERAISNGFEISARRQLAEYLKQSSPASEFRFVPPQVKMAACYGQRPIIKSMQKIARYYLSENTLILTVETSADRQKVLQVRTLQDLYPKLYKPRARQ